MFKLKKLNLQGLILKIPPLILTSENMQKSKYNVHLSSKDIAGLTYLYNF